MICVRHIIFPSSPEWRQRLQWDNYKLTRERRLVERSILSTQPWSNVSTEDDFSCLEAFCGNYHQLLQQVLELQINSGDWQRREEAVPEKTQGKKYIVNSISQADCICSVSSHTPPPKKMCSRWQPFKESVKMSPALPSHPYFIMPRITQGHCRGNSSFLGWI